MNGISYFADMMGKNKSFGQRCIDYISFAISFSKWSKTTGTTFIEIENKRLSIAFAITSGKLFKNMKNWINATGFDGIHNRFLYMSIPKSPYIRPQE